MKKHRLRYRNAELYQDDLAWYVGTKEQIHQAVCKVQFLSQQMGWTGSESPTWPVGEFFHPSNGDEFASPCFTKEPVSLRYVAHSASMCWPKSASWI